MPNEPRHNSAYAEYVFSNIRSMLESGGGMYNYKEMAEMVGLKPTQHFKRRVNQMWAHGLISMTNVFTPRGGIEKRFSAVTTPETKELPF